MTEVQKAVYDFIRQYVREYRRGLTFREIQKHFGYSSPNSAQEQVRALRAQGLLRSDLKGARSIMPVSEEDGIPVFGTIPAGIPIDAAPGEIERIALDDSFFSKRRGRVFALRVRGHSMVKAGIHDGDIVFLTERAPQSGEIVAALVDQQSTLKRFIERGGRAVLKAEGKGFRDVYPAEQLVIQGVMVGLIRRSSR